MSRKNVNLVFPRILGFERYIDVIFMGAAKINHRVYAGSDAILLDRTLILSYKGRFSIKTVI